MEVFIDFGLFELLAAAGVAFVSRKIYTRSVPAAACLLLSLIAPAALLFISKEGLARWVAAVCLFTTLVNVSLIFSLMRRWDMSTLLEKPPPPSSSTVPRQGS